MTAATPAVMGGADAPPVVEDPTAPSMRAEALAGLRVPSGAVTPALAPAPPPAGPAGGAAGSAGGAAAGGAGAGAGGAEMPPVPRVDAWELGPRPPARLGAQRGRCGDATPGAAPGGGVDAGGYVRLRLRLDAGRLSLAGARAVAGPLLQPVRLHAGLACEVTVAGHRVAVDSIPDLGIWRSLPAPGRPGGERQGHHVTELDAFEFQVRVPRGDLPIGSLPDVRVAVYRCKGTAPSEEIGPGPIAEQFRRELREVASVDGVRLWELPADVQEELRDQLR
jgi:hypothetical protein